MTELPGTAQINFGDKKITILQPDKAPSDFSQTDFSPLYNEALISELKKVTKKITIKKWGDSDIFDVDKTDLVIVLDAKRAPFGTLTAVNDYLKKGGRLLTIGGPAFTEPMFETDGKWYTRSEMMNEFSKISEGKTPIIDDTDANELKRLTRNTDNEADKQEVTFGDYGSLAGENSIKVYIENLKSWDNVRKEITVPEEDNAVAFWAKGDSRTGSICMEIGEKDGSRWIATITLSEEWKYYILTADNFVYWNDNSSVGRGGSGDKVNIPEAKYITVGLALSHTPVETGEHVFYLDEFVTTQFENMTENFVIEGLSPEYKFYPITNAATVKAFDNQIFVRKGDYKVGNELFSLSPRPQGTGYLKQRDFRFVPLLEVYDEKNLRSGFGAWMYIFTPTESGKNNYEGSILAGFGANDEAFYDKAGITAVCDTARAMFLDALLVEGGTDEYIYLDGTKEIKAGAYSKVKAKTDASVSVQLIGKDSVINEKSFAFEKNEALKTKSNNGINIFRSEYGYKLDSERPDRVVTALKIGDVVVDKIEQDISYWSPKPESERKFVYKENNEFMRDGKPLRLYGVNYMPSSGIAVDDGSYFEHYVSDEAYDPDVFYKDLQRVKEVGFNAVSLFVYYNTIQNSNNILHLIEMCESMGIYVDLSIRPYANPLEYKPSEVEVLIKKLRFPENDNIIAYDIAWERTFGTYEGDYGNSAGRKAFDADWRAWIDVQYGSLENAEAAWGCKALKDSDGFVIGVSDDMLRNGKGFEKMVAAYRRFVGDIVSQKHAYARDHIRALDPNHLVSFRTGGPGTIPLADPASYGFDYQSLASSMDFMSPESYALAPNEESMRQGVFTNIYSRYVKPGSPVVWKEFGRHIWTGSNFTDNSKFEQIQADYFGYIYEMLLQGHTGGAYCWWWPGGYRTNENSDFGIVNPDGSDRLVTKVIREYKDKFMNQPVLPEPDYFINIDRDAYSSGIKGVYENIQNELFSAIKEGKTVAFTNEAINTDTSTVKDIATGNIQSSGKMPPKYVNGEIRSVELKQPDGTYLPIERGGSCKINGNDIILRITACNTQYSKWITKGTGAVSIISTADSDISLKLPISFEVPYLGMVTEEYTINGLKNGNTKILLRFTAEGRFEFGDVYSFELVK